MSVVRYILTCNPQFFMMFPMLAYCTPQPASGDYFLEIRRRLRENDLWVGKFY
jgi:hypothetical protein